MRSRRATRCGAMTATGAPCRRRMRKGRCPDHQGATEAPQQHAMATGVHATHDPFGAAPAVEEAPLLPGERPYGPPVAVYGIVSEQEAVEQSQAALDRLMAVSRHAPGEADEALRTYAEALSVEERTLRARPREQTVAVPTSERTRRITGRDKVGLTKQGREQLKAVERAAADARRRKPASQAPPPDETLSPEQAIAKVNDTHDECLRVNQNGKWSELDPDRSMGGYQMPDDLMRSLAGHARAVSAMERAHGIAPEPSPEGWGRRSAAVNGPVYDDIPLSERGWEVVKRTEQACLDEAVSAGRAPASVI